MRSVQSGGDLDKLLAEWDEQAVDEVAERMASRVFPEAFDVERLVSTEVEELREALRDVAHRLVHVGQCAWELRGISAVPPLGSPARAVVHVAIQELYIWAIGTMCSDGPFHRLISSYATREEPFSAATQGLDHLNEIAVCARSRLALGSRRAGHSNTTEDPEVPTGIVEETLGSIQARSDLYIALLRNLISPCGVDNVDISDCFVTLCALALDITADGLRLLWPI